MRNTIIVTALLLTTLATSTHAQMRKCTDANGKVSYSDVACPNTTQEGAVSNKVSTLDNTGARKQVALANKAKAEEEKRLIAEGKAVAKAAKEQKKADDTKKARAGDTGSTTGSSGTAPILPPKPNIR